MSYSFFGKGTIYFALVDPVEATVTIKARGNYSAIETKEIVQQVEERFLEVPGLASVYLRAGSEWWNSEADKIGGGFIEIAPASERKNSGLEIMKLLNESVNDLPGIFVEIAPDLGGPSFDNPIELNLFGVSQDSVNDAADKVESHMRTKITGLKNITSSKSYPSVEWSVEVDKQKALLLVSNLKKKKNNGIVQICTNDDHLPPLVPSAARNMPNVPQVRNMFWGP